jgi:hypothetical protein
VSVHVHAAVLVQLDADEKIRRGTYSDADDYQIRLDAFARIQHDGLDRAAALSALPQC